MSTVRENFRRIVKTAFIEFVDEQIRMNYERGVESRNARSAPPMEKEELDLQPDELSEETAEETAEPSSSVVTTDEELEGLEIVKSIVSSLVDTERVKMRDNPSYCPVFLDSNRKPLCRFYFDGQQKQIGLFDGSRYSGGSLIASMHDIGGGQEIHNYADQLRETAQRYLES